MYPSGIQDFQVMRSVIQNRPPPLLALMIPVKLEHTCFNHDATVLVLEPSTDDRVHVLTERPVAEASYLPSTTPPNTPTNSFKSKKSFFKKI